MENYKELLEQINENDMVMKELFEKRMKILDKMLMENDGINNKSILKNNYLNEYNFFMDNLHSLEKNYQYNLKLKLYRDKMDVENQKIDVQNVCYQGLPFSYSEAAAKTLFKNKNLVNKNSFECVFKDVYDGIADVGVIPLENSTAGYVNEVYDLLLKYDLFINYSYVKKIDHCLAGTQDSVFEDIKEVHSHPQALAQCDKYIKNHKLKVINETNTAVAAKKIKDLNNKSIACICSPEAADYYKLKIYDLKINHIDNYTRFGAISKKIITDESHNRMSIVFSVPHEKGTLNNVLSLFSYYNINLSSIYSRPDLNSPWKYLFYLDFECNLLNENIKTIIYQLEKEIPFIKLLGSYKTN